MCGIAGYVVSKAPTKKFLGGIERLVRAMQSRGADATGAAWLHPETEKLWTWRAAIQADEALKAEWWTKIFAEHAPRSAIFHTRAATGGASPKKAKNNHPFAGAYGALVHNGILSNWKEVDKRLGLDKYRKSETDSETLLHLVEQEMSVFHDTMKAKRTKLSPIRKAAILTGAGEYCLDKIAGSVACAYLSQEVGALLLFAGTSSPLNIVVFPNGDMAFASTKHSLEWAFEGQVQRRGPLHLWAHYSADRDDMFAVIPQGSKPPELFYRKARSAWQRARDRHKKQETVLTKTSLTGTQTQNLLSPTGTIKQDGDGNFIVTNPLVTVGMKPCAGCKCDTSGAYCTVYDGAGTELRRYCYTCYKDYMGLNSTAKACALCKVTFSRWNCLPSREFGGVCTDCVGN